MITENEQIAIQTYLHQLALDWWNDQPESRTFATCDSCSAMPIERNHGYLIGSYLWCSDCFQGKAIPWIKKDGLDRMLGVEVLAKAMEVARSTSKGICVPIFIDDTNFKINNVDIPIAPHKDVLYNCLGTPPRECIESKDTVYVFDDYGISFFVYKNSIIVDSVNFILKPKNCDSLPEFMKGPHLYETSPKKFFQGPLVINGIDIPLGETIDKIQAVRPEINSHDDYVLSLGHRKMQFHVGSFMGPNPYLIETIDIWDSE